MNNKQITEKIEKEVWDKAYKNRKSKTPLTIDWMMKEGITLALKEKDDENKDLWDSLRDAEEECAKKGKRLMELKMNLTQRNTEIKKAIDEIEKRHYEIIQELTNGFGYEGDINFKKLKQKLGVEKSGEGGEQLEKINSKIT